MLKTLLPLIFTIRSQIILAFSLLVFPFILASYFSIKTQKTFSDDYRKIVEMGRVSSRISMLERDVVDMQRNVLIFKSSYSSNAKHNVDNLYLSITQSLNELEALSGYSIGVDEVKDIRFYADEYYKNFILASEYVDQVEIIKSLILNDVVNSDIEVDSVNSDRSKVVLSMRKDALYSVLHYLSSSSSSEINKAQDSLKKIDIEFPMLKGSKFYSEIEGLQSRISKLVLVRQNYTYLINVVMAGNASEIMYNTRHLHSLFSSESNKMSDNTANYIDKIKEINVFFVGLGVLFAAVLGVYFFTVITRPIVSISRVFEDISAGKSVDNIPGLDRVDEIGFLARSAQVFRRMNEQTVILLDDATKAAEVQSALNKKLEVEKVKAENALRARTQFLANMSHELRTPLNSIIGFSVRLIKTDSGLEPRKIEVLKTILRNGKHLLAMINDILDLSKIEENKLELSISQFDISDVVSEAIDLLHVSAEHKNLTIEFDPTPIEIESDPVRLTQIVLNILSNSIKYTETGGITCRVSIDAETDQVMIEVSDTGIGIAEEDLHKLFTRFEQFASNRTEKIGFGTGLGLAIVANVSRLLGGGVAASSNLGCGSTFTVTLPKVYMGSAL